jgi:hypothetical protein
MLMRHTAFLILMFAAGVAGGLGATEGATWARFQKQAAVTLQAAQRNSKPLPELPAGVQELRFQDLFNPVIGDRGPEYTDIVKRLNGKKVRVAGFMVRELNRKGGVFMLAPWPTRIESDGYCVYEDFPPATLHVLLPEVFTKPLPFSPGLLAVTGTLDLSPGQMPDGRNCVASIRLDPESTPIGFSLPQP